MYDLKDQYFGLEDCKISWRYPSYGHAWCYGMKNVGICGPYTLQDFEVKLFGYVYVEHLPIVSTFMNTVDYEHLPPNWVQWTPDQNNTVGVQRKRGSNKCVIIWCKRGFLVLSKLKEKGEVQISGKLLAKWHESLIMNIAAKGWGHIERIDMPLGYHRYWYAGYT